MRTSLLLLLVLFGSCNSSKESENPEDIEKRRMIDERERIIDDLSRRYDPKYSWDTLYYEYSIDYEPVLFTDYQLLENVTVKDIFRRDSLLYVAMTTSGYPEFHFVFPIQDHQIPLLKDYDKHFILVVSVKQLQKIHLSIDATIENEEYANVDIKDSDHFVGKGEIVELKYVEP